MVDYLTLAEVIIMHDDQLLQHGGAEGIRDIGSLEAAILRPQSGYYEGLLPQAAALWESLSQNHPFVDGNKRTAFISTYVFLAINGIEMTASAGSATEFVLGLYQNHCFKYDLLLHWLEENTGEAHP